MLAGHSSNEALAVGCSKSSVSRWKTRFAQADPRDVAVLFSRSRAPHHHPPRLAEEVVERIIEMRLAPPGNLKRTPGPKALLYYLSRDETLRLGGFCLPRSTRTSLPDPRPGRAHRACRAAQAFSLPKPEPLQEVQVDFKDITTVTVDPTAPSEKRQLHTLVCHFVGAGSSRLLSAQAHEDFHAETAFDAVVQFLRQYGPAWAY